MKKTGFTLAEVLITLTIIGVIAVLTIPNLMQKHQDQEMISRLKKSYSVFTNAYQLSIRENGTPSEWNTTSTDTTIRSDEFLKNLLPYLKTQKVCTKGKYGCFTGTAGCSHKSLTGQCNWWGNLDGYYYARGILQDGTTFALNADKQCPNNYCGYILVDVNGKKGPNQIGIDTFWLSLGLNKITPLKDKGMCTNDETKTTNKQQNGKGCSWWALYKGNMDYKYRDISAEW